MCVLAWGTGVSPVPDSVIVTLCQSISVGLSLYVSISVSLRVSVGTRGSGTSVSVYTLRCLYRYTLRAPVCLEGEGVRECMSRGVSRHSGP